MLFGPIGLALAHTAAQQTGEKKAEGAAPLRVDIVDATQRVLAEELNRRHEEVRFARDGDPAQASIEIAPYLVLTFVGNDQVRPWVVLKTALKDRSGEQKWATRYQAALGENRPLRGENGWASADGEPFRQAVDRALRAAVDVFLRDATGKLPRTGGRRVKVNAHWVWVNKPLEFTAEVLEETADIIVVKPDVSDVIVFAGINILDRKAVSVRAESE